MRTVTWGKAGPRTDPGGVARLCESTDTQASPDLFRAQQNG